MLLKRCDSPLFFFHVSQLKDWMPKRLDAENAKMFLNRNAFCISTFAKNTIERKHCIFGLSFVVIPIKVSSFNLLRDIQNVHNLTGNFECFSCSVVFGCAELIETHEKQIFLQAALLFFNALCAITTCKLLVFKLRSLILSKFSGYTLNSKTWNFSNF